MQDLNTLAQKIHENAKAKGFWDKPRSTGEIFMLIVSELGEALEADRSGKRASLEAYEFYRVSIKNDTAAFEAHIKDTFEDEIADVVIRALDYCGFANIVITHNQLEDRIDGYSGEKAERLLAMTANLFYANASAEVGDMEGVQAEMWVLINKCFSLAVSENFDLFRHIELKMQYNATRERLHGKKY